MTKSLEQYLSDAMDRGAIDHALRAHRGLDGKVTFYVRPLSGDGETLDFVVRGNGMVLNVTESSDVPSAVDTLLATRIPVLDLITELCYAIEKCGASPELTDAVTKASALRKPITELVEQAIALGLDTGRMSATSSLQAVEPVGAAVEGSSLSSYERTPIDDAIGLGHCASSAAAALVQMRVNGAVADAAAATALSTMVKLFAEKACSKLSC